MAKTNPDARWFDLFYETMVAGLRVLSRESFSPYVARGIPVSMACIDRRGALPCR